MDIKKEAKKWADIFTQVNRDCEATGESVVALSDTEYYTSQLEDLEVEHAEKVAVAMADYYDNGGYEETWTDPAGGIHHHEDDPTGKKNR